MKNHGIIFYGLQEQVLEEAYRTAINYLSNNTPTDTVMKHVPANTYPNFLLIKKSTDENEISIDESRRIIEFLSKKPTLPGRRVVLVENFEDMSRNAANSILKILEEPPVDSLLILSTSKLSSILPTVRSRCIKIRVKADLVVPTNYQDPQNFIEAVLSKVDASFIRISIDYLANGCKGITEFSKRYVENANEFLEIAILYFSFLCSKNGDQYAAKRVLNLQKFLNTTINTYPDKQAIIISASTISVENI